ncbi:MAG: hypothetical protein WBW62_10870 [Solirubrobacterales bacterium]
MSNSQTHGSRFLVPGFAVALGFVWLAVGIIAGDPVGGAAAMGVMFFYSLVLFFGGSRSESVRLLRGDPEDERQRHMQLKVAATTMWLLAPVLVAGALWSVAVDAASAPVWLGLTAYAGICQLAFTLFYTRRG